MSTAPFADARRRLVDEITAQARETETWTGRAAFSATTLAAIARVPRETFVPEAEKAFAYANRPLAIGHGQTISQPYIVALMTDMADLSPDARVLEIGTGCGYQSAVLAECAHTVYSVETIQALAQKSTAHLSALGYQNVHVHHGDGNQGWPEHAPFDGIIVTAAARRIPPALIDQLGPKGRMIIPVGAPGGPQMLTLGTKRLDGSFEKHPFLPVAFVPLVENDTRKSLY